MNYLATSINESPVIVGTANAAITDIRGHAVKFNANGNVVLCGAGETPLGIGIMTQGTEGAVAQGEDITIQHKDIGYVCAGAAFVQGANLSTDANGAFVTATTEGTATPVVAIALQAAGAAGQYVPAILRF